MNLVETYITNIQSERLCEETTFPLYEIIADTDCYGHKEYGKKLILNQYDYDSVKKNGYYMS